MAVALFECIRPLVSGIRLARKVRRYERLEHPAFALLVGRCAVEAGLRAIHWFNPLLIRAFNLLRADCEMACDEFVLERSSPAARERERHTYGHVLLRLAELNLQADKIGWQKAKMGQGTLPGADKAVPLRVAAKRVLPMSNDS